MLQGRPKPQRASQPAPTGLTSQCGQLLGGTEVEHGAHQLRARLLQEDGQDGPAVSVYHLLALIGQGHGQFGAYRIKSVNDFFLKYKRITCEDGRLGRAGKDFLKILTGPGNHSTARCCFLPQITRTTKQGQVASSSPSPEAPTGGKWLY